MSPFRIFDDILEFFTIIQFTAFMNFTYLRNVFNFIKKTCYLLWTGINLQYALREVLQEATLSYRVYLHEYYFPSVLLVKICANLNTFL